MEITVKKQKRVKNWKDEIFERIGRPKTSPIPPLSEQIKSEMFKIKLYNDEDIRSTKPAEPEKVVPPKEATSDSEKPKEKVEPPKGTA